MKALERVRFDNRAIRALPMDGNRQNSVRQVPHACFSWVAPTPLLNPTTVAFSQPALEELGVDPASAQGPHFAEFLSGNRNLIGSETAAHCYCGHQFGNFAGQLGDGAAIYLGEIVAENEDGTTTRRELQLKGAGPTPYSRNADGRKVLRSSIREFLASEAMHALGIPTTRAVSCVTSDTTVERDPLYTGRIIQERCTVVARTAETFIRFGSFEICKPASDHSDRAGPSADDPELMATLFDFVAHTYFPALLEEARVALQPPVDTFTLRKEACLLIFSEVVKRTAELVAQWQCVGFCHGVLNTDNMSIIGLTIDYGPYGFMGYFDENYICNHSDDGGRYSYKNQPAMCKWNLVKLAEAWSIMCPMNKDSFLERVEAFDEHFESKKLEIMAKKLGIPANIAESNKQDVSDLDKHVFATLQATSADMTNTFQLLSKLPMPPPDVAAEDLDDDVKAAQDQALASLADEIAATCASPAQMASVIHRQVSRGRPQMHPTQVVQVLAMAEEDPERVSAMFGGAPMGALKAQLQAELEKAEKTAAGKVRLMKYREMDDDEKRSQDAAAWREFLERYQETLIRMKAPADRNRQALMAGSNPKFVLHQWLLRDAITAAESSSGKYDLIQQLLDRSLEPYEEDIRDGDLWRKQPPADSCDICVSCSS